MGCSSPTVYYEASPRHARGGVQVGVAWQHQATTGHLCQVRQFMDEKPA